VGFTPHRPLIRRGRRRRRYGGWEDSVRDHVVFQHSIVTHLRWGSNGDLSGPLLVTVLVGELLRLTLLDSALLQASLNVDGNFDERLYLGALNSASTLENIPQSDGIRTSLNASTPAFFWRLIKFWRCLLRVRMVETIALSLSKTPSSRVKEDRLRMGIAVPRLTGSVGAGPAATETARVTRRSRADLLNIVTEGGPNEGVSPQERLGREIQLESVLAKTLAL
jgi:hypothetical protein